MEVAITTKNESHTFNLSESDYDLLIRIAASLDKERQD